MSVLLDMLIPACALSAVAAGGLKLLPKAPVRLRLALALAGLIAWVLPWPWIRLPWTLPSVLETRLEPLAAAISAIGPAATSQWTGDGATAAGPMAEIAADCAALRKSIAGW